MKFFSFWLSFSRDILSCMLAGSVSLTVSELSALTVVMCYANIYCKTAIGVRTKWSFVCQSVWELGLRWELQLWLSITVSLHFILEVTFAVIDSMLPTYTPPTCPVGYWIPWYWSKFFFYISLLNNHKQPLPTYWLVLIVSPSEIPR